MTDSTGQQLPYNSLYQHGYLLLLAQNVHVVQHLNAAFG